MGRELLNLEIVEGEYSWRNPRGIGYENQGEIKEILNGIQLCEFIAIAINLIYTINFYFVSM
ncbi:hypothetical protein Igag_0681 [Ignisphaera aggregans DSM 17230]|uniref:Uncharacterized protein n=1 Tax=Ignisphaera aggregans (strain DSM 17230 / JCM 13409 / AQ1.S1) TaxID=583356 RepID=E0SSW1_IGNAA|nr:hypothetical protein Igag_0681 [Ignisphaera aggregans DSM 17230]